MNDRLKAAVDARTEPSFQIMARTDGLAVEGVDATLERAARYVDAGADMLFLEATPNLETYAMFSKAIGVPLLANITEFGSTPLFTVEELGSVGVRIVLYPLSAFRAANQAADRVYKLIASDGSQAKAIESMQTRAELYDVLDYYRYEAEIDRTLADDSPARD
jgi:methylisocitrate lyase